MSKFYALFTLLFITNVCADLRGLDYYPADFQAEYHQLSPKELRAKLHRILGSFHIKQEGKPDRVVESCPKQTECYAQERNISYKRAREHLFGELHLQGSGKNVWVRDVYCHNHARAESGVGRGKIPNASVQNCEHTWPQSKFNRNEDMNLQKTDLHHLFPVDSRANSSRSNNPFGDVSGSDVHENCAASQKGDILGTNTKGFEPPEDHKGNVARAMFYFAVRFNSSLPNDYVRRLKAWSELDPVDAFERERNEKIYEIQGTRNPFIDEPELVQAFNEL